MITNGHHWKSPAQNAQLALRIIQFATIIYCQISSFFIPWLKRNGSKDAWKRSAYILACSFFILYDLLIIIDLIVNQTIAYLPNEYSILYIFEDAGILVSEVFIFAVLFRSIEQYWTTSTHNRRVLWIIHLIILILYTIVSIICLVFYIANIAAALGSDNTLWTIRRYKYEIPRAAIGIIAAIEILVFVLIINVRQHFSKLSKSLLLSSAILMMLYQIVGLVTVFIYDVLRRNAAESVVVDYIITVLMTGIFVTIIHSVRAFKKDVDVGLGNNNPKHGIPEIIVDHPPYEMSSQPKMNQEQHFGFLDVQQRVEMPHQTQQHYELAAIEEAKCS